MIALVGGTVAELHPARVERADVVIEHGRIVQVGGEIPNGATRIDARGCLVTPGFVVGHTHLYSSLARGMPPPPLAPATFPEILERVWWKLDRALDDELVSTSALVGAIEAAKCGATCILDHHASPRAISGSLDRIAAALRDVGIRGVLCYETSDRDGRESRAGGLAENARFASGVAREPESHVRAMIGAHAPFTLEDDTLDALAELSTRLAAPLHVHVGEDATDRADAARRGATLEARLERMGALRPGVVVAHAVDLDPRAREAVARAGAWIVTNARSNMTNGVGLSPARGERVALGTDGIGADMIAECQAHFFRHAEARDELAADAVARLVGAQRLAALRFDGAASTPRIAPGERADLAILDYDPPTPMSAANLAGHVLFGWSSARVRDTIAGGRVVVRDRVVQTVDERAVLAKARAEAARLWARMSELH